METILGIVKLISMIIAVVTLLTFVGIVVYDLLFSEDGEPFILDM